MLFLSQAAVGGALGAYVLMVGDALYNYQNGYLFLLVGALPFSLLAGALFGLVAGVLTLVVEDLIEERLSLLPRVLVTTALTTLILVGLSAFQDKVDWQLVRVLILPGIGLGVPSALVARSRLRLGRALVFGVGQGPRAGHAQPGVPAFSTLFSLIGGLALRLVSAIGFLISAMVLACCWYLQERDQVLVTTFAIYYFTCTAFISFTECKPWAVAAAGTFLNALVLVLGLFWDPAAAAGQPGPLTIAFLGLAFLWMLFLGGRVLATRRRVVAPAQLLMAGNNEVR